MLLSFSSSSKIIKRRTVTTVAIKQLVLLDSEQRPIDARQTRAKEELVSFRRDLLAMFSLMSALEQIFCFLFIRQSKTNLVTSIRYRSAENTVNTFSTSHFIKTA